MVVLMISCAAFVGVGSEASAQGKKPPVTHGTITGRLQVVNGIGGNCSPNGAFVHLPGFSILTRMAGNGLFFLFNVPVGVFTVRIEVPGDANPHHDYQVTIDSASEDMGTVTIACGSTE